MNRLKEAKKKNPSGKSDCCGSWLGIFTWNPLMTLVLIGISAFFWRVEPPKQRTNWFQACNFQIEYVISKQIQAMLWEKNPHQPQIHETSFASTGPCTPKGKIIWSQMLAVKFHHEYHECRLDKSDFYWRILILPEGKSLDEIPKRSNDEKRRPVSRSMNPWAVGEHSADIFLLLCGWGVERCGVDRYNLIDELFSDS